MSHECKNYYKKTKPYETDKVLFPVTRRFKKGQTVSVKTVHFFLEESRKMKNEKDYIKKFSPLTQFFSVPVQR
jgi:hypothetical protein